MLKRVTTWIDERSGFVKMTTEEMFKPLPMGVGWAFSLGSAVLFLIIVMFVTGITMATVYAPTPDHAYRSVQYFESSVGFGRIVRGLHHWSASAVVVVTVLHILRVLFYGGYKKPRELTWMLGVCLFLVILGFSFTGYLLPWDQKAYWATVVGTKIAGSVPFVGDAMTKVLRGSAEVGALTLTRFYAMHVMLLPWLLIGLLAGHLYLVRKHGSAGPWSPYRGSVSGPNLFYPNQVFKDLVVAAGLLLLMLFLAVKYGAPLEPLADPSDTSYVPRPEWYFLSLYQLLKYLPGPLEVVGTVVIPGVVGVLLFFLPMLDRKEERGPHHRPWVIFPTALILVGIALLTIISYRTAPAVPSATQTASVTGPSSAQLAGNATHGKALFDEHGCGGCHKVNGQGGDAGPSLTHVGSQQKSDFLKKKITNPKFNNPQTIMPPTPGPKKDVDDLVAFVQSLK